MRDAASTELSFSKSTLGSVQRTSISFGEIAFARTFEGVCNWKRRSSRKKKKQVHHKQFRELTWEKSWKQWRLIPSVIFELETLYSWNYGDSVDFFTYIHATIIFPHLSLYGNLCGETFLSSPTSLSGKIFTWRSNHECILQLLLFRHSMTSKGRATAPKWHEQLQHISLFHHPHIIYFRPINWIWSWWSVAKFPFINSLFAAHLTVS